MAASKRVLSFCRLAFYRRRFDSNIFNGGLNCLMIKNESHYLIYGRVNALVFSFVRNPYSTTNIMWINAMYVAIYVPVHTLASA